LDLWACDALEQAVLEFEGTCIVVSHDRYFLNRVVDLLLVLEGNGKVQVIYGNYDTYQRMRTLQPLHKGPAKQDRPAPAAQGGKEKVRRKRRFPFRKTEELETEIATEEAKLRETEALLASSELYKDGQKVKETMRSFEESKARLKHLYEHWEEAVELN
jgi:ATP-binding cassette, subfamily F, member 3